MPFTGLGNFLEPHILKLIYGMKIKVFFSWILGSLLLLSSCQSDSIDTTEKLEVDTSKIITLDSSSGYTRISVLSSPLKWTANTTADWLELKPVGDYLFIYAQPNTTGMKRRAEVQISSGRTTRRALVEQESSPTLNLNRDGSSTEVFLPALGGEVRLVPPVGGGDWQVQPSKGVDWLETSPMPQAGYILIRARSNAAKQARSAQLQILSGGKNYPVEVHQAAYEQYLLPQCLWGMDLADVEQAERARGSRLITLPNRRSRPRIPDYTFSTTNSELHTIKYELLDYSDRMLYLATLIGSSSTINSLAYHNYLVDQGFVRITPVGNTRGAIEYVHNDRKTQLHITTKGDLGYVYCRYLAEQPGSMPTLPRLDLGIRRFGQATSRDVEAWEKTQSGIYSQDLSRAFGIPAYFLPDPLYARAYFFKKNASPQTLQEYLTLYSDYRVGAYLYGDMPYLTAEFRQLLQDEGFTFHSYSPVSQAYIYVNDAEHLGLSAGIMHIGGKHRMRVSIFPY